MSHVPSPPVSLLPILMENVVTWLLSCLLLLNKNVQVPKIQLRACGLFYVVCSAYLCNPWSREWAPFVPIWSHSVVTVLPLT